MNTQEPVTPFNPVEGHYVRLTDLILRPYPNPDHIANAVCDVRPDLGMTLMRDECVQIGRIIGNAENADAANIGNHRGEFIPVGTMLLKGGAPVFEAAPEQLSEADSNVLMRLDRLIRSWEYFGVGNTVARVADSADSYVALSVEDMSALLRLATRAQQ